MTLTLAWVPLAVFGLASLRVLGVLLVAPGWSWVPVWIRGFIALGLTLALEPLRVPADTMTQAVGPEWILGAAMALATGVVMGEVLAFAFAALTTAGQLIMSLLGVELAGTSQAGILSASSGFSSWWTWIGLLVFLHQDGLLLVIDALRASVQALPLTYWGIPQDAWTYLIGLFSNLLAMTILLAAPVVAVVLASIFLIALISRAYPQLQIYFLASPGMILLSLLTLWVMGPWMVPLLTQLWHLTWMQLSHVLALWHAGIPPSARRLVVP